MQTEAMKSDLESTNLINFEIDWKLLPCKNQNIEGDFDFFYCRV